jgi:site-specific DNA-adenine methylase
MTNNSLIYARTTKDNLSFAGENLLRGRHKIHPYPAMLHPLLVDSLLKDFAKEDDIVYDPFCGSGVVLLQSNLQGHNSIGFDINPMALLIAKVKTRKYDVRILKNEFETFKTSVMRTKNADIPDIKNIEYWYAKDVINDLGRVRAVLKKNGYKYHDFFICVFAFICRNQSWTRNGEFKRYRIEESKLANTKNNVIKKLFDHIEGMIDIIAAEQPLKSSKPILANSENTISDKINYDLVITSPPYGDSRTTVAYGEYSSFGAEWTNDLNYYWANDLKTYLNKQSVPATKSKDAHKGYKVDKECMGKVGALHEKLGDHSILNNVIDQIRLKDKKRANDVLYFFNDYYKSMTNVVNNLNAKGKVCFIVGNRTVKDVQIPMDQITASFLESLGMKFEHIFVREILNKIMPASNSPTNKVGATSKTMSNEYIVIASKV